jgi:hypothetical protein
VQHSDLKYAIYIDRMLVKRFINSIIIRKVINFNVYGSISSISLNKTTVERNQSLRGSPSGNQLSMYATRRAMYFNTLMLSIIHSTCNPQSSYAVHIFAWTSAISMHMILVRIIHLACNLRLFYAVRIFLSKWATDMNIVLVRMIHLACNRRSFYSVHILL